MLTRRKILLVVTIVVVLGSLTSTISYALHLRSRGLRERITADLSGQLKMDLDIGAVTPWSFSGRRFDDIAVRLPERETQIAKLGYAVWREEHTGSTESFALDISDGWLLVGAGHWTPEDYQRLLESGFGHDFAALRLTEVNVHNVDFCWRHADFAMTAPAANGVIFFEEGRGRAILTADRLNDTTVDEPIHISARFTPGEGMVFQQAEIRVGAIPLQALGLDSLLGTPVTAGTFTGRITYRDAAQPHWTVEVGGSLTGACLEELTAQVIGGPFTGRVDVTIDRALFAPGPDSRTQLQSLCFAGQLLNLQLAQFAPLFREPGLNGRIDFTVHQLEYANHDLEYVRLSGKAADVSLEALTHLLGYGVVTGRLEVRINALAIVDNVIQFADVDLIAVPPENGPAFIEKAALASVGREVFGLDLEPILPERVQYVRMGMKLLLDREGLRVRGTHGPDNRTILTISLWGREVGILKQPEEAYLVEDIVALVRSRLKDYDSEQFIRWWTERHTEPEQ